MANTVVDLPLKTLFTPAEVAHFFGVSRMTIYRWVELGKLLAVTPSGGCLRIYRESIIKLLEESKK